MTDSESQTPPRRSRWELNREALEQLLRAFDPDREGGSRRYEALRRKLTDLFAWERAEAPEELADETLNRLAKRISEGANVAGDKLDQYAYGIARLLLHEERRSRGNRQAALRELRLRRQEAREADSEIVHLLNECLNALPRQSRELIESYYNEDREALAGRLGISLNALRNRALRIRDQLYHCVSRSRDVR